MTKAERYDTIILLKSMDKFKQGDKGAIVEVYTVPYEAYDIEIFNENGQTKGIAEAVLPEQFKIIFSSESKSLNQSKHAVPVN